MDAEGKFTVVGLKPLGGGGSGTIPVPRNETDGCGVRNVSERSEVARRRKKTVPIAHWWIIDNKVREGRWNVPNLSGERMAQKYQEWQQP
jgi:hypothetical protein